MYTPDKSYNLNAAEEMDLEEKKKHQEEMERAFERLEKNKRTRKKALFCGLSGLIVGVLYIIYIALGIEWIDKLLNNLSGGSGVIRFALDFAPPFIIAGLSGFFIARGEKGIIRYILSSTMVFVIVLLVFLVYISLMMM